MWHQQLNRKDVLQPFLDEGTRPLAEPVHGGSRVAAGLVEPSRQIVLCGEAHRSGRWERPNWTA
jgi:hypothetical protein